MKRSNQLIFESLVVASLLLGVVLGGSASTYALPHAWISIQNPQEIQPLYNMTSLAYFYNNTLSALSKYEYQNVSQELSAFQYLVVSPSVSSASQDANGEIASMNQTFPKIQYYLNETEHFYLSGLRANASAALNNLCSYDQIANASLAQFAGSTTASFNASGVPVVVYRIPAIVLQGEINSYYEECLNYRSTLNGSSVVALTVSSDQAPISPYGPLWVDTGGELNLSVSLVENGIGIANQPISIYVDSNSTSPASLVTNSSGRAFGTLTIPYFYESFVLVYATYQSNNQLVVSNVLNMTLLYNQTQIIINDPPQVLPTYPFNVSGTLKDSSTGRVLPGAPVRITSFGAGYFTKTDSQGVFSDTLNVPANATDGLHYIYANFAPNGAYGPSVNFTSIVVYRLPVNLTVSKPSLVIPGLTSTLFGLVSANGSALSNTQVLLSTPWGAYRATTDSSGRFSLPFSVPLTDFGFNAQMALGASPSQAYLSGASTSVVLGLVNLITIAIIIFALGFGVYMARNLGVRLPKIGRDLEQRETKEEVNETKTPSKIPSELSSKASDPIISSYLEALALAEEKFNVRFEESMTIRETSGFVSNLVKERGKEARAIFNSIALAAEDYLYSEKSKDPNYLTRETTLVKEHLLKLKSLWNA